MLQMASMVEQATSIREIADGYTTLWPVATHPVNMGPVMATTLKCPHGDHLTPTEALTSGASNHQMSYMVLDPVQYNALENTGKMQGVQLFDPTAEDAMCQAAYMAGTGERNYIKDDRPCCYLVQFAIDPFNLGGHMYSQYMSVYRRGYSVVGLQVNTCYKFCEPEIQSMTVVKYIFNPLEKYRVYNWRSGYIWKQGRVIQYMKILELPTENRHHAACMMALQDSTSHLYSFLLGLQDVITVRKAIDYMRAFGQDGHMTVTSADPSTVPGHPDYFEYMSGVRAATRPRST